MVAIEDADLVNYLDFNGINALTFSCQILHANRKTTRIRWMRFHFKLEQSEIYKLDPRRIAPFYTNVPSIKLSSEGLNFAISLVKTTFDNGIYWPIEGLLSVMPNLEPHLLYACTTYCLDKLNANENQSKVWSATQLKISDILFSLSTRTPYSVYDLSTPSVTSKPNFRRHLENDNYDVVKALWPYVYWQKELEAGLIKYNLVEFIAQSPTTINKIDFLLKLGIKTCRTRHQEYKPFLEAMLSAVFKVKRDDETVQTVERLIALGANPMEAVMPIAEKNHHRYSEKVQEQANGMAEIVDVLVLAGIDLTNMYGSVLGRSLCRQYESRYTDVIDYLIELDQVDVFEVVKSVLWKSSCLKRQNEELVERAIEVSVKHGHDHVLNLLAKRSDLNRMTGRHAVLAAKCCQGVSFEWLLQAGVEPTSDEIHDIISNILSRKPHAPLQGKMSDTHVLQVVWNRKLITPVELFDILVEFCSGNRVNNWHSAYWILDWMSQKALINEFLTDRGEGAFIILTNSIENSEYFLADLCFTLNFAKGRKMRAIEEKNGESEKRVAALEMILQIAAGQRTKSKLFLAWIFDTPGFNPSRAIIRRLLFSSLDSKPAAIDVFEQLLDFDYVSQLEIYKGLSLSYCYHLEPSDLAAMLRILVKRGSEPPPISFVNKFYRLPVLLSLAKLNYSDTLLWFLNMGVRPSFEFASLTEICLRRNLFDVIEKLVDLNWVTLDLIVDLTCNDLKVTSTARYCQWDLSQHRVVLWMLKSGYLDYPPLANRERANLLLENALKFKKVLISNTLMAVGVGSLDANKSVESSS
ncbi:hypothetical protein HDU76_002202 [Blyttiomyces sp. JEL0837]|nr:hypothetical protein HDU76_002202 [Blyttiomyces sp. JEL0837]